MKRAVVVGGGISGLSAAYELQRTGWKVTLVEKDRMGGVIRTERAGGFLIEGGPDSFITQKPWARRLCEEIGLGDQLVPSRGRKVHVLWKGELHEVPAGVLLTVPTRIGPFLSSRLFSWAGKLRMGMDLVLPRGEEVEDESIGSFVRRRLGREALEKLADPIMGGIFSAPADELSIRCTFPRFADMEREHRSLIKALIKAPPAGDASPFLTLRGGMGDLVDRLVLRMEGVTFITGKEVVGLERGWKVHLADGTLEADAVVMAIPAPSLGEIWPGVPSIRHVSSSTVTLAYRRFRDLDGSGFVVPRREGRPLTACTWTSSKFDGRCPEDHLLVRCFLTATEGDLATIAHEQLKRILGVQEDPVLSRVTVWKERSPVFEVGHLKRIREFEERLPPGLKVTGAGFRGAGLPDCIRDGREAARSLGAG